ncbi:MAG: restriction endonuclease subunit S [Acidimicrobiales bacterium]
MTEWQEVTLGDGLDVHHGFAFKGKFFQEAGNLIVLTPGNFIDEGGFKQKSGKEKYFDGPYPSSFLLSAGDVVVAMTEQAQGLLGSTATIPEGDRFLHNQRIGLLEITDANLLDLRFVYHLLNTPAVRTQIQATATGAKIRHTAPTRIRAVRATIPDVPVQRMVAGILDDLGDLIENNRRRVEVLEEMTRAIYREWFVHFRYPGHEDATFVDSPLGLIPEGWEASTCGDELTALGGGTPSKKEPAYWDGGTIPWFTPSDLTKSRNRYAADSELRITAEGLAKSSARVSPAGSVLMTSRATLGVLTIATAQATTNQGFIVIHPDSRWSPGFIYEWFDAHADELASVATGATFKEITKGAFKRVPFLVPQRDVLGAHGRATDPLEAQIDTIEQQTRNLATLRDLLLPKLVTGQIDVSSLDLDAVIGAD